jgi:glycosyltransferase involved in cell wall biosynthesis
LSAKLLFLAPSAYPLGGVAVWLDYLIPGLETLGFQCTLGLVAGRVHDAQRYMRGRSAVRVVAIENQTGSAEGRRRSLVDCIDRIAPDAVLGVNIGDAFPAVRRIRCLGEGRPKIIMTLHGIEADLFADMKANADLIDGVIASNRLACALSSTVGGVPSARVHYAPYGVPRQGRNRGLEWGSAGVVRVAWVGRFEQAQKRVFDLEGVMQQLSASESRFVLRMVGDGPDRPALENRLARFTAEGCVEWLGAIPSGAMSSRVYSATDALLVTSVWETGPIIIWEAMAAGIPVVSTRYTGTGLEGALSDGDNCLLFDVGDVRGAADAIQRLRDPALRARVIESGMDLVSSRYSIDASITAWRQAIGVVLEGPPSGCDREVLPASSGRLDRWLGVSRAETLRRWSGIRYQHADAGGEWPHSLSPSTGREELFRTAYALDFPEKSRG